MGRGQQLQHQRRVDAHLDEVVPQLDISGLRDLFVGDLLAAVLGLLVVGALVHADEGRHADRARRSRGQQVGAGRGAAGEFAARRAELDAGSFGLPADLRGCDAGGGFRVGDVDIQPPGADHAADLERCGAAAAGRIDEHGQLAITDRFQGRAEA